MSETNGEGHADSYYFRENERLRAKLSSLGHDTPQRTSDLSLLESGKISMLSSVRANNASCEPCDNVHGRDSLTQQELQSRTQQNTSSSRTLSGPVLGRVDGLTLPQGKEPSPNDANRTNTKRNEMMDEGLPNQRPTKSSRRDSADSRVLMPPPPRPQAPATHECISGLSSGKGLEAHSELAETSQSPLQPLSSTMSPKQGGIFLRDDGTWERVTGSPRKSSQRDSIEMFRNKVIPIDDAQIRRNIANADNYSSCSESRAWHLEQDSFIADSPFAKKPGALGEVSYEQGTPMRGFTGETRNSVNGQRGRAGSNQGEMPSQDRGNGFYHQQSLRQHSPLGASSEAYLNRLSRKEQNRSQWQLQGGGSLDRYRYADEGDFNQVTRHNIFSNPSQPSNYQVYEQEPKTPSPPKNAFRLPESVASPFFRKTPARERTGRLTFPERKNVSSIPEWLVAPQKRKQEGQNHFQRRGMNETIQMSSPVRKSSGLSVYQREPSASIPVSPHFGGQSLGRTPIEPRPNMFAADDSHHATLNRHSQQISVDDRTFVGSSLGRSGPTRMSLEGRKANGGGLADYLQAQEGSLFNRRLARR